MEHNRAWVYIIGIIAAGLVSIIGLDIISKGKVKREEEKTKQAHERTLQTKYVWQIDSAKIITQEAKYTWKSDSISNVGSTCDKDENR